MKKQATKLKNAFQKTMSKSRKRTFKTKRGVLKRIYCRDPIWNDNRKKGLLKINKFFERVTSFSKVKFI